MADNTLQTAAANIATDDIGGVHYQIMKLGFGALDAVTLVTSTSGLPVGGTQSAVSSTAWTSATGSNTANSISVTGMNTVTVAVTNTSTMTGGVLTFEVSPDNTNWFTIAMGRIDSFTVETTYTLNVVANRAWSTSVDGFTNFRVRLSTVITGTGTATVLITAQAMPVEPIVTVGQSVAGSLVNTPSQPQFWYEADVPGVVAAVYAAGDQFGTQISIANAARLTGGGGWITGVTLFDNDDLQVGADVFFYNDTTTPAADNAVFAMSDADQRKELWCAQIPYFMDTGAQRVGQIVGISIPYFCTATTLYAVIRTQSAVTPTATGVRIRVSMIRD